MIITLKHLRESKCNTLYNDIIINGTLVGASVHIDDNIANGILNKCNEPIDIQPIVTITKQLPLHYDKWPLALRLLSRLNGNKNDKGMGDMIERIVGPIGGDLFKKWWKETIGSDCGCGHRKEWLNERYPFS